MTVDKTPTAGPDAREWPVAKRVERLTSLRRLATMCEQRLADVEGVVFACTGILEILPGDRDALDRMELVLEKAGDTRRLEQTLEYHAASAKGRRARQGAAPAGAHRRGARRSGGRDGAVGAGRQGRPNDPDALAALANLYERHSRWSELAAVLERLAIPAPGSSQRPGPAANRSPGPRPRSARTARPARGAPPS